MADYPPPFPQNGAFIQKMCDESGGIPYMVYIDRGHGYHVSVHKLIALQMIKLAHNDQFLCYKRSINNYLWRSEIVYAIREMLIRMDVRMDFMSDRFIRQFIRQYFRTVALRHHGFAGYKPKFGKNIVLHELRIRDVGAYSHISEVSQWF